MDSLIINTATLSQNLTKVIVLDCRFSLADVTAGQTSYDQGHIPGAYYCDLDKHLSGEITQHGGRHPLPTFERFVQQLNNWGVTPRSEVVVYDDQKMAFASRAWWLLKIAGIHKVRVLDGGYQSWIQAGNAQDRRKPPEKRSDITPNNRPNNFDFAKTENAEAITAALESNAMTLIDSREPMRYRGDSEPIDPIAGHIPTAQNLPWNEVTDDTGFLKPQSFHDQRWGKIANAASQPVIYCGSGVTACVNLLSAAVAGHQFSIYPGSWSDWISYDDAPIATSA